MGLICQYIGKYRLVDMESTDANFLKKTFKFCLMGFCALCKTFVPNNGPL